MGGPAQFLRIALHRFWWNHFARTDPFWAVLTEPGKKGGHWQPDEFFASGQATIRDELGKLRACGIVLRTERALDFGCGLGRLTNALAEHFAHTTGVDISRPMLDRATSFLRHPERTTLLATADPQLAALPSDQFDLVYSEITLQHIPPAETERYIASFVRLTRPGGAISFQLPAHIPVETPVIEKLKFSTWPPTLLKRICRISWRALVRRWEKLVDRFGTHIPMYAIPRERVVALLEAAGAHVVEVATNPAAGPTIESYHYRAVKPLRTAP